MAIKISYQMSAPYLICGSPIITSILSVCTCACLGYKESYSEHLLNIFLCIELIDQRMFFKHLDELC